MHFDAILSPDARVDLALGNSHVFRPVPGLHQALLGEGGEDTLGRGAEMSLDDKAVSRHGVYPFGLLGS